MAADAIEQDLIALMDGDMVYMVPIPKHENEYARYTLKNNSKSIDDIELIDDGMKPYESLMMPLPKNEFEYGLYSVR